MTAQPVVPGPGQERQFWTSMSHGTVKVESGTTCPPTTGRWYENLGINYERLVQIKRRYDPDNIFRLNHNIDPAQSRRPAIPGHAGPATGRPACDMQNI